MTRTPSCRPLTTSNTTPSRGGVRGCRVAATRARTTRTLLRTAMTAPVIDAPIAVVVRFQTRPTLARRLWAARRNPVTMVDADDLTAAALLCQALAVLCRARLAARPSFLVPTDPSDPTARRICLEVRATLTRIRRPSSASVHTHDLVKEAARIRESATLPRARRTPCRNVACPAYANDRVVTIAPRLAATTAVRTAPTPRV